MVRVKLVTKYPLSYCVDREKQEVTVDGKSGFVSVTSKPDVAGNKFIVESEYIEVTETVSFGKKIPTDGLVLEFPIFEGSGTTLHDTSGNNNNGTIYGAVWKKLPTGKYVLSFDGKDDYVKVPNNFNFDLPTTLIITGRPIVKSHENTFCGCFKESSPRFGWFLRVQWGKLQLEVWDNETLYRTDFIYIELDKVYQIAVVSYGKGEGADVYVNAEHVGAHDYGLVHYTDEFFIGNRSSVVNPNYAFMGDIGYALLYQKALKQSKINKIFEATAPLFGISP